MQPLDNTVRVIVLRGHDGDIQSAINDLRSNIDYEDYDVKVEEPRQQPKRCGHHQVEVDHVFKAGAKACVCGLMGRS
jgi:hypothetical protein